MPQITIIEVKPRQDPARKRVRIPVLVLHLDRPVVVEPLVPPLRETPRPQAHL